MLSNCQTKPIRIILPVRIPSLGAKVLLLAYDSDEDSRNSYLIEFRLMENSFLGFSSSINSSSVIDEGP
jgi:hypothetical protein